MRDCSVCRGDGVVCRECRERLEDCVCTFPGVRPVLVDCLNCDGKGEVEEGEWDDEDDGW